MHLSPNNLLTLAHTVSVPSALISYSIYTQSSTECIHRSHSSLVGKIDYNKVFVFFTKTGTNIIRKGRNFHSQTWGFSALKINMSINDNNDNISAIKATVEQIIFIKLNLMIKWSDLSFLSSLLPLCQLPAGWRWFQSESWHQQQWPPCAQTPPSHGSLLKGPIPIRHMHDNQSTVVFYLDKISLIFILWSATSCQGLLH